MGGTMAQPLSCWGSGKVFQGQVLDRKGVWDSRTSHRCERLKHKLGREKLSRWKGNLNKQSPKREQKRQNTRPN